MANWLKILPFIVFATALSAAEVELKNKEIDALLKGNSIAGVHYGNKTAQYFSESGLTLWIQEGDAKPSEGRWEIKEDKYCSDFGSGSGCFTIMHDKAQGIYYFIQKDFRAPFVTKPGYNFTVN